MEGLKKIHSIRTRTDVEVGFVHCPCTYNVTGFEESDLFIRMKFRKPNGDEELHVFEKEPGKKYSYLGRLQSIPEKDCAEIVDSADRFKDYHSGRYYLSSAYVSLHTAALATDFPLGKYENPVLLIAKQERKPAA